MPALPQPVLHAKLKAALPDTTVFASGDEIHPAELTVPGIGELRIYLWTVSHVESQDRPFDEYKIQLILPNQERTVRGQLVTGDRPTFVLGYSPDFGVFVGWESRLHEDFAFSSALQIKESTLENGRRSGWDVAAPRDVTAGTEIRVVFSPANLLHYLKVSIDADSQSISGRRREGLFLTNTPNFDAGTLRDAVAPPETLVKQLRRKLLVVRAQRDARFGPLVREQYQSSCAVCGKQMGIIEGAHIIPASAEDGKDEIWNGVALCPNHHKLFDASTFIVLPSLTLRIDQSAIEFLRQSGLDRGVDEELVPFDDRTLTSPSFFTTDDSLRDRMIEALTWRARLGAVS